MRWVSGRLLLLVALTACAPISTVDLPRFPWQRPPEPPPTLRPELVDDVAAARAFLEEARARTRLDAGQPAAERAAALAELGLYDEADSVIAASGGHTPELLAARADVRFRQYRFAEARALARAALERQPRNRLARLVSARLALLAGEDARAQQEARALVSAGRRRGDADAALLLARLHLQHDDTAGALAWSERARDWNPGDAGPMVFQAEVQAARGREGAAEGALRAALALDPLDAGARYAFGRALMRREAPALRGLVAAQWALALDLDPMHLEAHRQFASGTFATAPRAEDGAHAALARADSLLARGLLGETLALTRKVQAERTASPLPALVRGSAWYLLGERMDSTYLDSAEVAFRAVLDAAPRHPLAHRGMGAVLAKRRSQALAAYDSLEAAIDRAEPVRGDVFPGLGDRAARMVGQQLGAMRVYLPLLERRGARLEIVPLHTTRAGVAIDELEEGSHGAPSALHREFSRLVHDEILTDAQRRQVADLYRRADDPPATEADYFADLVASGENPWRRDVESANRGFDSHLRSNRAEVYLRLAEEARDARGIRASALLDSALIWDARYLPAMLGYAQLEIARGRLSRAEEWIEGVEQIDRGYAPTLAARAELAAAQGESYGASFETRVSLMRRAVDSERDPVTRAGLARDLRELFVRLGRVPEAIEAALAYAAEAPESPSRTVRGARDEARLAALTLRMRLGYAGEVLPELRERVATAPDDDTARAAYVDALVMAGQVGAALEQLEAHGGPGLALRLAELRLALGDTVAARRHAYAALVAGTSGRLVRLLIDLGESTEAQRQVARLAGAEDPGERAELLFTRGWISAWRRDPRMAERLYAEAIDLDPYHLPARVALHRLLLREGREEEAAHLVEIGRGLPIPLGPEAGL